MCFQRPLCFPRRGMSYGGCAFLGQNQPPPLRMPSPPGGPQLSQLFRSFFAAAASMWPLIWATIACMPRSAASPADTDEHTAHLVHQPRPSHSVVRAVYCPFLPARAHMFGFVEGLSLRTICRCGCLETRAFAVLMSSRVPLGRRLAPAGVLKASLQSFQNSSLVLATRSRHQTSHSAPSPLSVLRLLVMERTESLLFHFRLAFFARLKILSRSRPVDRRPSYTAPCVATV